MTNAFAKQVTTYPPVRPLEGASRAPVNIGWNDKYDPTTIANKRVTDEKQINNNVKEGQCWRTTMERKTMKKFPQPTLLPVPVCAVLVSAFSKPSSGVALVLNYI